MLNKLCVECNKNPQLKQRRICKECYSKLKEKSKKKDFCFICEKEFTLNRKNQRVCYECHIDCSRRRCREGLRKNNLKANKPKFKYTREEAQKFLDFAISNKGININSLNFFDYHRSNPNSLENLNKLIEENKLDSFYKENNK